MQSLLSLNNFTINLYGKDIVSGLSLDVHNGDFVVFAVSDDRSLKSFFDVISGKERLPKNIKITGDLSYKGAPVGEAGYPGMFNYLPAHFRLRVFDILAEAIPNRGQLTRLEQNELIASVVDDLNGKSLNIDLDGRLLDHDPYSQNLIRLAYCLLRQDDLIIQPEPAFSLCSHDASRYFSVLDRVRQSGPGVIISSDLDRAAFPENVRFINTSGKNSSLLPTPEVVTADDLSASQPDKEVSSAETKDSVFDGLIWCSSAETFGVLQQNDGANSTGYDVRKIVFAQANPELLFEAKARNIKTHQLNLHPKIAPTVDACFKICQSLEGLIKQYGVVHLYANREGLLGQLLAAAYHIFLGYGIQETMDALHQVFPALSEHEDYSEFSSYLTSFSSF